MNKNANDTWGHTTDNYTGAVTTPIYQTSTYLQDDIGDLRQGTNIHVLQILHVRLLKVLLLI